MKHTNLTFLTTYLRPFWQRVVLLFGLLLAGIVLQLFAPQVIRRFLDAAQAGETTRVLVTMGLVYLLIVVGQKALNLLNTYLSTDLGWAATNRLRGDLAVHTMRLDMGFHKTRTPGEIIERIDGDVGNLAEYFSNLIVHVFSNALLLVGVLFLLFREDWRFGLIGLVYALVTAVFLRLIQKPNVTFWGDISRAEANLFGYLEERFGGTEDIRANGGEAYVMQGLYPKMALIARKRIQVDLFGGFTFAASTMFYVLTLVVTLALAGVLYLRGEMTIGAVFLMAFYVGLMEGPIKYIRRQMGNLQRAVASISRINEFFQLEPEVKDLASTGSASASTGSASTGSASASTGSATASTGSVTELVEVPEPVEVTEPADVAVLPRQAPSVQFANVSFAYKDQFSLSPTLSQGEREPVSSPFGGGPGWGEGSNLVLDDVSFTLEAGKVLGVLGRTGSGKTTLTRLLFRLYDVDAGQIFLDGVDVRYAGLRDLRQHVGMVTQEVQLFEATVRDNLTLFRRYDPERPPISDAAIVDAIDTLGLSDWFQALPDGLDTMLKTGGQGLSAGEAQLLAFTRLFLRDPYLVILDEASSRLDPATEQLLERAIDRLLHRRTGIIIAHRLQTVQRADEILILENGRSLENGARTVLANDSNSRFYHLLQTGLEEVLA
ncbi:MAG: ABC transporter ATP-binding protein [Chloroflexota bacterium]